MQSRILPPLILLLSLSFAFPIIENENNGIKEHRGPDFPTGYGYNINIDAPQTSAVSLLKNKRYEGGEVNGSDDPGGDAVGVESDVDGGHFGTWRKRGVENGEVVGGRWIEGGNVEVEPVNGVNAVVSRPTYDGGK